MKLTGPFELSKYTLQHGLGLSRSASLGVETLRHDASGLYYADMNVVLSADGYRIGKNPITYKTLRVIPNNKLLFNENDVMNELNLGAIYDSPRGMFMVRKTDGTFVYIPEYVRGVGLYPTIYLSQLTDIVNRAEMTQSIFGQYQIGTQEYVIQELRDRLNRRAVTTDKLRAELQQILETRQVKQTVYGR